jgi:hypothetical protein
LQPDVYFFSSVQVNADIYVVFAEPTPRSAIGATAGYKFNNMLGHGVGGGFYAEIDPRKPLSFFLMGGVWFFPQGEDRLREREMFPAGTEFTFPGPGFNWGINGGIVFSP